MYEKDYSVEEFDCNLEMGGNIPTKKTEQAIKFAQENRIKIPRKKLFESKKTFLRRNNKFCFYVLKIRNNVKKISHLSEKVAINYETSQKDKSIFIKDDLRNQMENMDFLKLDYTEKIEAIFRESKQKLVLAENLFYKSQRLLAKRK